MISKQKIKSIIILAIIMSIISLTCIFHSFFNSFIAYFMLKNFKVVSNYNNLLVHYVSVGHGDGIAINFPDGKTMLIDVGPKASASKYSNYLQENVVSTKFNNTIDYLVLTHADSDHIGGTLRVLDQFDIQTVYFPKIEANSDTYKEIADVVKNNYDYVEITEGVEIKSSGYKINFLGPMDYKSTNSSCPMIKIEYMDQGFLFAGDIPIEIENLFLEKYKDELKCNVLKVAHHGSDTSSSEEFLKATNSEFAIVSSGNMYNLPNNEIVDRLKDNNMQVLRTDTDGDIVFVVGDNYELNYITDEFFITSFSFDYRYIVIVVDVTLAVIIVAIVLKKDKKKKKQ